MEKIDTTIFPLEESQGDTPLDPNNWPKALAGYTIISVILGRLSMFKMLIPYIEKYFTIIHNEEKKMGILESSYVFSHALAIIPLTYLLKFDNFRHKIYGSLILLSSLSFFLIGFIHNYEIFCIFCGGICGIANSSITVYPLLKIRDFMVTFKNKTFYTGLLICLSIGIEHWLSLFFIWIMDPSFAIFSGSNNPLCFTKWIKIYSFLSLFIGMIGFILVLWSEKDDRYTGIEGESESSVYLSENFDQDYEVDAESN